MCPTDAETALPSDPVQTTQPAPAPTITPEFDETSGFWLAPPTQLKSHTIKKENIVVKAQTILEDLTVDVDFMVYVEPIEADDEDPNHDDAVLSREIALAYHQFATSALERLGIPRNAQHTGDIYSEGDRLYVEKNCRFLVLPSNRKIVDPEIVKGLNIDIGSAYMKADREFALNATIPAKFISEEPRTLNRKLQDFGQYAIGAYPWWGQWLMEISGHIELDEHYSEAGYYIFHTPIAEFDYDQNDHRNRHLKNSLLIYDYQVRPVLFRY